jgi:IclR family KDG regulon transcriptional repressor
MSKTLAKALDLLMLFSEDKPYWKLDDISRQASVPKPTAFRLIKTLEKYGLIQRVTFYQRGYFVQGELYQLGPKLLEMGHIVSTQYEVRNIALPYMRRLQDQLNESVQLVIMDNDEAIYIEKVESTQPVHLYTRIGRRAPLYAGACPRVLLSFLSDQEIARILSLPKQDYDIHSTFNKEEVWEKILETRRNGYSYSDSELVEGTAAIGTPIFGANGDIVASLSVAGFASKLTKKEAPKFVGSMWEVSEKISNQLGFNKRYEDMFNLIKG